MNPIVRAILLGIFSLLILMAVFIFERLDGSNVSDSLVFIFGMCAGGFLQVICTDGVEKTKSN